MCFIYDEYPEASEQVVRMARKRHMCEGCGRGVGSGERYTENTGIFEGEPFRYRVCGACELDAWIIFIHEISEGCGRGESWIAPGDLPDYRSEHEMQQSSIEDGQRFMKLREERRRQRDDYLLAGVHVR